MIVNDSMLKTNSWTYKIRNLNEEIIIESFCEKRNSY